MMVNPLDPLSSEELSQLAISAEVASFGPVAGFARASHCLAALSKFRSPVRLHKSVADHLLSNFESTRPGAEILFHSMVGYQPHRLNQDLRRLRLRFLPNHTFGKVALFSRVPSDSTSLRECADKGEGFAIMWKLVATGVKTWLRDDYGAQTFRTTTSKRSPMAACCQASHERPEHWRNS